MFKKRCLDFSELANKNISMQPLTGFLRTTKQKCHQTIAIIRSPKYKVISSNRTFAVFHVKQRIKMCSSECSLASKDRFKNLSFKSCAEFSDNSGCRYFVTVQFCNYRELFTGREKQSECFLPGA